MAVATRTGAIPYDVYRLYYEVNGQVFMDAFLHQHDLPEDADSVECLGVGSPSRGGFAASS